MNLSSSIPQLFYDLIARVIPGAILLGLTFYILEGSKKLVDGFKAGCSLSFSSILGILFLSYVVGTLLGGVWFLILDSKLFKSKGKNIEDIITDQIKTNKVYIDTNKLKTPETSFIYEYIKIFNPPAGARIAKLKAERDMCGILIIGTVPLIILAIFVRSCLFLEPLIVLMIFLATGILLLKHLNECFVNSLSNVWLILHSKDMENRKREI
ncbi:MAG: hypothetical protein KAW12_30795 [Candidatus Aminicenantes bacterium]|nr:hypothetical protein [Candidatus Aminicenantes bacterium]